MRRDSVKPAWFFELLSALAMVIVVAQCSPALSATPGELLTNGLLSEGRDGQPTGWRYEAMASGPDAVRFDWEVYASGVGVLKIVNLKLNDSKWAQDFEVSPSTWYRVSGWVRSEKALPALGARLTAGDYSSAELHGTSDWQILQFWVKTSGDQKSMELQCHLGGVSAISTGTAYFAALSVAEGKPGPSAPVELIFGARLWDYPNRRKTLTYLLCMLSAIAVAPWLWRFVLPSSQVR